MKKYGAVKILQRTLLIPPQDDNTTHFQAHPWLCVLVVYCVLCARAVLLGSNTYAPKNWLTTTRLGLPERSFQDDSAYCI
jgi:hypothetical protein